MGVRSCAPVWSMRSRARCQGFHGEGWSTGVSAVAPVPPRGARGTPPSPQGAKVHLSTYVCRSKSDNFEFSGKHRLLLFGRSTVNEKFSPKVILILSGSSHIFVNRKLAFCSYFCPRCTGDVIYIFSYMDDCVHNILG